MLGRVDLTADVRTRTTLVCGALALVIAVSALLRAGRRVRTVHWLFAGFAADIGLWYLSQSLFGFYQVALWGRLRVGLAVLLPVLAVSLFDAMVPPRPGERRSPWPRLALVTGIPLAGVGLSNFVEHTWVRIAIFSYDVVFVALGLYELGQRGRASRSRAVRRRVQFLVVTGALAGTFTVADFAWVIGYEPAYHPPPVGVVLSIVFLFILAQALRHERLLDLYEMFGRLVVATAVAFLIGFVFYLLVTVIGQFNTMWLNAILAAIVVLVLFNPLRDWVEKQIQRYVFRETRRLGALLARARRRLAHTLDVDEMGAIVVDAFERSRSVTTAALYVLLDDGLTYERLASVGSGAPARIEVATAGPLLEQLWHGPVVLERLRRDLEEGRTSPARHVSAEALLAAAEVLGPARERAVVIGVVTEENEQVGLMIVADERIDDAFSPEDIAVLEELAAQLGVVIENSRVYDKMKEKDRLVMLGQMAAGLAHEIRNPLGAIKGAAQLLADPSEDDGEQQREFLGIIIEEVERLDNVVGTVLALARARQDTATAIDVNAVVRRTLQVMSAEWSDLSVEVVAELDDDLPRATIEPDQLRQVLMNLVQNGVQAMAGEGRLTVATRTRTRGDARFVAIAVRDEGPGISRAALKNIFLPFFTTKDQGTGLGLAISQRIVETAGGRIEVRSREGEGTTFEVVLPAAEAFGTPTPSKARTIATPDAELARPRRG